MTLKNIDMTVSSPERHIIHRSDAGEAFLKTVPVKTVPYTIQIPAHYATFLSKIDEASAFIQSVTLREIREKIESYASAPYGHPDLPSTKAVIEFQEQEAALANAKA